MASNPHADLRELLFADLSAARAREVFGHVSAPIVALADASEAHDASAAAVALAQLDAANPETRVRLQAFALARAAGVAPDADAKDVFGVVVDMGLAEGLDTLAAFADGSARYFNHSGAALVWDPPDMTVGQLARALLDAAAAIAIMTGTLDGPRPAAPGSGQAMISVLTPGGIHFGVGPADALANDPWAGPVITAATELMAHLIERSGH